MFKQLDVVTDADWCWEGFRDTLDKRLIKNKNSAKIKLKRKWGWLMFTTNFLRTTPTVRVPAASLPTAPFYFCLFAFSFLSKHTKKQSKEKDQMVWWFFWCLHSMLGPMLIACVCACWQQIAFFLISCLFFVFYLFLFSFSSFLCFIQLWLNDFVANRWQNGEVVD